MKKTNEQKGKIRKNKEIGVVYTSSGIKPTKKEYINGMAKLCMLLLECDRKYQQKKLDSEEPQFCFYCKKQITELNDIYTYKDENICHNCATTLERDPNEPRTFCGIPVVEGGPPLEFADDEEEDS